MAAPSSPQLKISTPVLLVADVKRAAQYYTERLGFSLNRFWGAPPTFAIVHRDDVAVMLNQVGPGQDFRPNGDYDGRFSVYFDIADADQLHREFTAAGADVVCEPENLPYNQREFSVRDADGHLLGFGQDISKGSA